MVGENGAGKSTLMKILNGVYTMDSGEIRLSGNPLNIRSPHDARQAGIGMIFQEQILANDLTVAENTLLGMDRNGRPASSITANSTRRRRKSPRAPSLSPISANTRVARLTRAEKQLVEIARALATTARVIVMDEPTAVLSQKKSEALFRIIAELKAKGLAIVYISHRMEELEHLADRVTILRDGKVRLYGRSCVNRRPGIIRHMVGRDIHELYPKLPEPSTETVLEVSNLACGSNIATSHSSFIAERSWVLPDWSARPHGCSARHFRARSTGFRRDFSARQARQFSIHQ